MRIGKQVLQLVRDRSGVAITEFALALPFLLFAGLGGAELASYTHAHMKVSQVAMQIADNGSRIGDTSTLQDRKIYESDINDLIYGAHIQAGGLDLYGHGRVIISSLEVDPDTGNQYIHWQRCRGARKVDSSYGLAGDNLGTTGMGPKGNEVKAEPGDAVIFVEIVYEYQPMIANTFMGKSLISTTTAFTVRDDRDLSQVYQRNSGSPDPVQRCDIYSGAPTVSGKTVS